MSGLEPRRLRAHVIRALVIVCLAAVPALADPGRGADADWTALHQRSRDALAALGSPPDRSPAVEAARTIVVGFTGGLEGRNSAVSGVVRLRRAIDDHFGHSPAVTALTYNNFRWRRAASDVTALVRHMAVAEAGEGPAASLPPRQPLIVVYGHSWGAGAIGKFAREIGREGVQVTLAIYIDAFTLRSPRIPDNVQYAVNLYQRTGVFRGLPLRGKKTLTAVSPDTVILGSLRIRPETDHFGWNWNLVQPLLYRHHHRMGHDIRIQQYLIDLLALHLDRTAAAPGAPSF